MSSLDQQLAISRVKRWVEDFIVALNICPFARKEVQQKSIRYIVAEQHRDNALYESIETEIRFLQDNPTTETTLLILPTLDDDFESFLNSAGFAQQVIQLNGWTNEFQIANFHPDYVFADSNAKDAANYTNRAPHACLHLLREGSVERAIRAHKHAHAIPQDNIDQLRKLGLDNMKQRLQRIYETKQ